LHGGREGFDVRAWRVEWAFSDGSFAAVALARTSPAGEEGYPGELEARCVYTLAPPEAALPPGECYARLYIEHRARLVGPAGAVTPAALCNHAYFALGGAPESLAALPEGAALASHLQLNCSRLVPLRESDWLPPADGSTLAVGEAAGAGGAGERGAPGALDFRRGATLREKFELLNSGSGGSGGGPLDLRRGFNAYFLVDGWVPPPSLHPLDKPEPRPGQLPHAPELRGRLRILGSLSDPASERRMDVATTCPGVQLYTNFGYPPLAAGSTVCLETGYPPDTANTAFSAGGGVTVERSLLRAGEERSELTCHYFSWKEKKLPA